jgi:2-polyprenyl-6-methoxyphenol hydroxylase-like FAD-dependent oxidoreductase
VNSRLVVLGCGIAGLASAVAARPWFDEVVLVERDHLPRGPDPRRGVPQSSQLHNLLGRAQRHLDQLLPGFVDELVATGGTRVTVSLETHVHEMGTRMPERDLGLSLVTAPRPEIELLLRRRVLAVPGIRVVEGASAVGLLREGHRVTGALIEVGDVRRELEATAVIDAMGTGTPLCSWLADAGCPVPEVETVTVDRWYATLEVARPAAWRGSVRCWMVFPGPDGSRGALVSPLNADRWHVSVSGTSSDTPPRSLGEVQTFVANLSDPTIGNVLAGGDATGAPHLFRKPSATWRHHEALPSPLVGLMPVGDAFASLNPLYGQGVSVAVWQASELAEALRPQTGVGRTTIMYLARAAGVAQVAWSVAALASPEPSPESRDALTRLEAISMRVAGDPVLHRRYVRVWHLLDPLAAFLDDLGPERAVSC